MKRRVLPAIVAGLVVILAGCAGSPGASPSTSTVPPTPSTAPPIASPSPDPTPMDVGELTIDIDGVSFVRDGQTQDFPFDADGEELLALLEELTGQPREGEVIEDHYGGEWGTQYQWDGMSVNISAERTSVAVSSPTVGDVPVVTLEGLSVGSSRDDLVAVGARDGWDADQDGIADEMHLGELPVPGTQSLSRPGETGILYVLMRLEGDSVFQIQSPGNDFSDI